MKSVGSALTQYDWCHCKKRRKENTGKGHVREAEIVMMHLQTKGQKGLLIITRSQKERHRLDSPSRPSEEVLLTSNLHNCETVHL